MNALIKDTKDKIFPNIKLNNIVILLIFIIGLIIFFTTQSPYFFTKLNIFNILMQISILGFLAIPLTYIIISGAMDLSVGSILAISAVTIGYLHQLGINIWLSAVLGIIVAVIAGSFNGLLIAKYKMQAIVVTIATLVMYRGLVYVITQGNPISGYPKSFYFLGQGTLFGLPFNVIILILFYVLAYIVIKKTRIGRYIFALGNNEETVRYSGIKDRKSTRLNSSHVAISYAVFCLKKQKMGN